MRKAGRNVGSNVGITAESELASKIRCRGLTLIELMITLVILAATVTTAAPTLHSWIHGSRLRTEASRLLDAINLARSEAVSRNVPVSLCPSAMADSGAPECLGNFEGGWIVFTNRDRDATFDAGSDEIIRAFAAIPAGYSMTNRAGTRAVTDPITYLPDGSSRRNLTLLLCPPRGIAVEPWSVVLNTVGRARAQRLAPAQEDECLSAGG